MRDDILTRLAGRAKPLSRSVAFPDASDIRTLRAASALAAEKIVRPVLVGPAGLIRGLASDERIPLDGVAIEDPAGSPHRARLAAEYLAVGKGGGGSVRREAADLDRPLIFAGMMARTGLVGGCVAGSLSTTADVVRAALRTIGLRAGVRKVSGYFLMVFPDRVMSFADCGVLPDPDSADLAEIAGLTADNFRLVTGIEPVVAFLSFSTKGSAKHPMVVRVRDAASRFAAMRPDITSDGELQLDAAVSPDVARRKAPGSAAAGKANVLVFPDLDAGNIGYKIAERLGGAVALGPILQGLARPMFDLSRGCSVEDIVRVAAINALSSA
jgi:phosphate acetyltransferase